MTLSLVGSAILSGAAYVLTSAALSEDDDQCVVGLSGGLFALKVACLAKADTIW